jgi:hypothetical protein
LSGLGAFVGTFRLFIYLERIPPAVRPLALGEYFLRFFVRMVFTGHFGLARGHLFLLFLGALRPTESLVLPRLDEETENSFFTERFGGFQTMQAFNEHEPSAVHPYQDRCLLALVEHARGDFVHALFFKGGTPLDWHVDVCDRDGLALHHAGFHF